MENLQQLVIQLTTSPEVRVLLQFGTDFLPQSQTIINYEELSLDEKEIWDNFINMLKNR